jgi:CubicO group peptidase (beta-lactamase class C family)
MKKILISALLILTLNNVFSQIETIESIDNLFKNYNLNTPGCAIGVVKNGKLIYQKGFGSASLEYSIPNNLNIKFMIGSLTKQFTGACIAMLMTENKIKLDDDIRKYIPEFPFYGDTIRIRNLLYHNSGIKNYEIAMEMSGIGFNEIFDNYDHLLNLIYHQSSLVFKPDSKYSYSNSNYTLLGEIVFRVTGQKLEEFAERKLFKPLGMENTFYWITPKKIIKDRATGYSPLGHGEYEINQPLWIPYGSGNIISTINDLSKWCSFLIEQYKERTDFINVFTKIGYTSDGKPTNYAFGINISEYRGLKNYEHSGGLHGFRSRITIFPEQELSIIVLGNISNLWTYSATCLIADKYLKNQFTEGKDYIVPSTYQINAKLDDIITLDSKVLKIYENYYELGDGYMFEIKSTNYGLNIWESWSSSNYKVYPINDSSFIDSTCVVRFDFFNIKNAKANKLDVIYNGEKSTAVLDYVEATSTSLLIELTGFYFNKDLNTVYHFYLEKGTLLVRIGNEMPTKVLVVNKNLLSFFGFEAIIKRDDKNKIVGFELTNQQESRNNIFTKIVSD